jgi:NAD-dependent DNA ligase
MTAVEVDHSALKSSVAFTGRLACMSRAEAFDLVRRRRGTPSPEVTRHTQVLVVGELGWPLLDDGRPSNKLSRATSLGIPIVASDVSSNGSVNPLRTMIRKPTRLVNLLP